MKNKVKACFSYISTFILYIKFILVLLVDHTNLRPNIFTDVSNELAFGMTYLGTFQESYELNF